MSSVTPLIVTHPCALVRDGLPPILAKSPFRPISVAIRGGREHMDESRIRGVTLLHCRFLGQRSLSLISNVMTSHFNRLFG